MRVPLSLLPLVAALLCLAVTEARADRMPIPKTSVCNKTQQAVAVATSTNDTYAGWTSKGWVTIKPGACHEFRVDAFFFRGKRTVTGLAKNKVKGCVVEHKPFEITARDWKSDGAAKCTQAKGNIVDFTFAQNQRTNPPVHVVK